MFPVRGSRSSFPHTRGCSVDLHDVRDLGSHRPPSRRGVFRSDDGTSLMDGRSSPSRGGVPGFCDGLSVALALPPTRGCSDLDGPDQRPTHLVLPPSCGGVPQVLRRPGPPLNPFPRERGCFLWGGPFSASYGILPPPRGGVSSKLPTITSSSEPFPPLAGVFLVCHGRWPPPDGRPPPPHEGAVPAAVTGRDSSVASPLSQGGVPLLTSMHVLPRSRPP